MYRPDITVMVDWASKMVVGCGGRSLCYICTTNHFVVFLSQTLTEGSLDWQVDELVLGTYLYNMYRFSG